MRSGWPLAISVILLGSCAAREVTPVRISQPGDEFLTCAELRQQMMTNREAAEAFLRADKKVEAANAVKVVGGALPWVGILISASEDFSNEEQIKGRALVDRDEKLRFLSTKRQCPE